MSAIEATGAALKEIGDGGSVQDERTGVMTALARIEITEIVAGRPTTTVHFFPTEVAPALAERLRPVVDDVVARAAAAADLIPSDAALLLAGGVAQLAADAEAYEREAVRRGVLAL